MSFEINRGESKVEPHRDHHMITVPYTLSNRPYDIIVNEEDCKTPISSYISHTAESTPSSLQGFIDVVVNVTVNHQIKETSYWNGASDEGNYIFCLETSVFADQNLTMQANFLETKFQMSYSEMASFSFGVGISKNPVTSLTFNATLDLVVEARPSSLTEEVTKKMLDAILKVLGEMLPPSVTLTGFFATISGSRNRWLQEDDETTVLLTFSLCFTIHEECARDDCYGELAKDIYEKILALLKDMLQNGSFLSNLKEELTEQGLTEVKNVTLPVDTFEPNDFVDNSKYETKTDFVELSVSYDSYIRAFQCNENFEEVPSPPALTQGSVLQVCVVSTEKDTLNVEAITDLTLSQSGNSLAVDVVKDNKAVAAIARTNCEESLGICQARVQMFAGFFRTSDPPPLLVNGRILMGFSSSDRRNLQMRGVFNSPSGVDPESESFKMEIKLAQQREISGGTTKSILLAFSLIMFTVASLTE